MKTPLIPFKIMRLSNYLFFCLLAISLVYPIDSNAIVFNKKNKVEDVNIFKLSIDDNIAIPDLGKYATTIIEFQDKQYRNLIELSQKNYPYQIEKMRNDEVLCITIQSRFLFQQGDTILTEKGVDILSPFNQYLKTEGLYKIVLAMHSDNTGSERYTKMLTTKRVNAIYDAFISINSMMSNFIVPYPFGGEDPIVDNNSVLNREKNRRLVIYLIPDKVMINQAKRGKISL